MMGPIPFKLTQTNRKQQKKTQVLTAEEEAKRKEEEYQRKITARKQDIELLINQVG